MKHIYANKLRSFLIIVICTISAPSYSQGCEKGCAKITKVEPTTLKGVKPDRALLVFKFFGPTGKPAKSNLKIIVDKDTIMPVMDKTGSTKMTAREGAHKLKFKAPYWYT